MLGIGLEATLQATDAAYARDFLAAEAPLGLVDHGRSSTSRRTSSAQQAS